jgi:hypothetical protein
MGEFVGAGIRSSLQQSDSQGGLSAVRWPTSVQELSEGERLVVWAFRRWIVGRDQLPMLAREFDRQFRQADARHALIALDAAMTALTRHARRTITHHQACCPCLAADEVCVISIVAALQNDAIEAARAMAQWLVRAAGIDCFVAPLAELADCLGSSGLDLPYRAKQRGAARGKATLAVPAPVH